MGVQVLSWRRIKQLNRRADEAFVHAYTRDHGIWTCVRHDGSAVCIDVKTLERLGEPTIGSVTRSLLKERNPRTDHDRESLAEMDRRAEEWQSLSSAAP